MTARFVLESDHITLIRSSYSEIQALDSDDLAARFYTHLFEQFPEFKSLFEKVNMRHQHQMFVAMLGSVVDGIDNPDEVAQSLVKLGRRHEGYRVAPQMYGRFGRALIDTLGSVMGDSWSSELEEAWSLLYAEMIAHMIERGDVDRA